MRRAFVVGVLSVLATGSLAAQEAAAPATPAAAPAPAAAAPSGPPASVANSAAKSLGMVVYPAKGQDAATMAKDDQECYAWAKDQTGIDPAAVKSNPDSAAKAAQAHVDSAAAGIGVKGAAKGAAAGAIVGGITGNASEGAGVGAVAGAAAGRKAKKQAKAQAGAQAAEANKQHAQALIDKVKGAMTTCLTARGYTVS